MGARVSAHAMCQHSYMFEWGVGGKRLIAPPCRERHPTSKVDRNVDKNCYISKAWFLTSTLYHIPIIWTEMQPLHHRVKFKQGKTSISYDDPFSQTILKNVTKEPNVLANLAGSSYLMQRFIRLE